MTTAAPRLILHGILTLLSSAFIAAVPLAASRAADGTAGGGPPNIVLFLADDLGWVDNSVNGGGFFETPNLERLARLGLRFTQAYSASPLCSPTRASILTGQSPERLRFTTPSGHVERVVLDPVVPERGPAEDPVVCPQTRTRLPNDLVTFAEVLRDGGYRTGFFGKWHLGRAPYLPENQGFDVVVGGRHHPGPPSYFTPYRIETIPDGPDGEHVTDRIAAEAVAFMRANRDRPFLVNFWDYSVHAPFQAKPGLVEKYRAKADAMAAEDDGDAQRNPVYGAMVEVLDDAVGTLLDALEELDLLDRTLFIFTSDNGGNTYNFVGPGSRPITSNAPLRGGKGSIWEGGIRVPLIAAWPGHIAPGTTSGAVVSSIDLFPTILGAAGLETPAGHVVDGIDLVPVLTGATDAPARDAVFWHFPHFVAATGNRAASSVRQGDWKLIRYWGDAGSGGAGDRVVLFDLASDPGESRDRAAEQPVRVGALARLLDAHLEETSALVPRPNPGYARSLRGWNTVGDARAALTAQGLVVEASGPDPILSPVAVPRGLDGPLMLEVTVQADAACEVRVSWSAGEEQAFHRDRSVALGIDASDEPMVATARLPVEGTLSGLRLSMPGSGWLVIERIRLIAGTRVAKHWEFVP